MNLLNKYRVVLIIVLPILILVLIRSFSTNHFKSDAKELAGPSFNNLNIITANKINTLEGEKLILNLGEIPADNLTGSVLNIKPDSILLKTNFRLIRKHKGPILLFSDQEGISARVWMILSQMGIRNIYILVSDNDNEVLKYKFRPDTLIRPELIEE